MKRKRLATAAQIRRSAKSEAYRARHTSLAPSEAYQRWSV
jgi:hypothetical protein